MSETRLNYRQVAARLNIPQKAAYTILREGGRGLFVVGDDGRVNSEDLEAFVMEAVYGLTTAVDFPHADGPTAHGPQATGPPGPAGDDSGTPEPPRTPAPSDGH
jgi:hypothetical protein